MNNFQKKKKKTNDFLSDYILKSQEEILTIQKI